MTRRWSWSWAWAARLRERWRSRRRLRDRIGDRLVRFLTAPLSRYERPALNDLDALKRHIRKGDVLLSQGNQRISAIIKYLTQSSWSHSSLYVGDEILQRGGDLAERMRSEFGDEAAHLLIEALPEGVSLMPLSHYADFHIRLCRPHRIRPDDLKIILDRAIGAIGWRYDLRNIVDLALYYLPAELVPGRFRPKAARGLGSRAPESVICTRLIGELFGQVDRADSTAAPRPPSRRGRRRPHAPRRPGAAGRMASCPRPLPVCSRALLYRSDSRRRAGPRRPSP